MTYPYRENGNQYEAEYNTSDHFQTLHSADGLNRKLTNRRGEVLCSCDGTVEKVNACLANALAASKKIHAGVHHVAEQCSKHGLDQIEKLLIR
jgi:hypothetical protein